MIDFSTMTIEQLVEKREVILRNCEGWKKCSDGSYEMALDAAGLNMVDEEIVRRKREI